MKEFYKVTIGVDMVSFKRDTIFGVKNKVFGGFGNYTLFGSLKKVLENEDDIESMKDTFLNRITAQLEKDYKNVSINNIEWNITIEKASIQTAEWCIKNLTIPQLVEMGLTIMRESD